MVVRHLEGRDGKSWKEETRRELRQTLLAAAFIAERNGWDLEEEFRHAVLTDFLPRTFPHVTKKA